jgi:hypothetical protein
MFWNIFIKAQHCYSHLKEKEMIDRFRPHLLIIFYLLQVLFILMYMDAEIQPFVYVRF